MKQITYAGAFTAAFQLAEVGSQASTLHESVLPPGCQACVGRSQRSTLRRPITYQDEENGLLGMVAQLPAESLVPSESVVRLQSQVNTGAYNHPVVILQQSLCRHMVFCAPVTSFGQTSLMEKYKNAGSATKDNVFFRYMAFNHDARTEQHSALPLLNIDGDAMAKQSYLHLDHGFWIEWNNLSHFGRGLRYLSLPSLLDAQWAYTVAETHRQFSGPSPSTPAPSRTPSPPAWRLPEGYTTQYTPWTWAIPCLSLEPMSRATLMSGNWCSTASVIGQEIGGCTYY